MIPKEHSACVLIYIKEISAIVFTQRNGIRKAFNFGNHFHRLSNWNEAPHSRLIINSDDYRIRFGYSAVMAANEIHIF